LALLGPLALALAACAPLPQAVAPAALRSADSLGLAGPATPAIAADWWRAWGDERLNTLVALALQDQPSLKLAQARIRRAQAQAGVVASADAPQLNASLDVLDQRFTGTGLYPPPLAGTVRETGTLQLNGSWELDFFGKNQAALQAALGLQGAAQADAQAARVLLACNVVRGYWQLARLHDQLAVAQRSLAQRQDLLALVRERLAAGLDTRLELTQSEAGLPEVRQQIEQLQEQVELGRHALAALAGQARLPSLESLPSLEGVHPVAAPPVIPADLLGRRADVSAARWRVEAALQDRQAARALFYPNINLVGFAGLSSIGLGRLMQNNSLQWGFGPALRLPLFDGARLRSNLGVKDADLDAAIESYNATVIEALHEAADPLTSLSSLAQQQTEQAQAQAAAAQAHSIAQQRYQAGLSNRLAVLNAQSAVLAQQRAAIDLSARALDAHIALVRALGGGYAAAPAASFTDQAKPL